MRLTVRRRESGEKCFAPKGSQLVGHCLCLRVSPTWAPAPHLSSPGADQRHVRGANHHAMLLRSFKVALALDEAVVLPLGLVEHDAEPLPARVVHLAHVPHEPEVAPAHEHAAANAELAASTLRRRGRPGALRRRRRRRRLRPRTQHVQEHLNLPHRVRQGRKVRVNLALKPVPDLCARHFKRPHNLSGFEDGVSLRASG
mmetsp:Transcript_40728/g.127419  ORF Transcript_40728/g.127419 Transcript_40728/m.127419 type:complete len:200 (-) Transcript_40728:616-1215(-)